jgi:hypothetical protein
MSQTIFAGVPSGCAAVDADSTTASEDEQDFAQPRRIKVEPIPLNLTNSVDPSSTVLPRSAQPTTPAKSAPGKRKRNVIEADDDEDFGSLDSDTERALLTAATSVERSSAAPAPKRLATDTSGLPTPTTRRAATAAVARDGTTAPTTQHSMASTATLDTATLGTATLGAEEHEGGGDYDITTRVLSLLPAATTPAAAREAVREALNGHAVRVSGIRKARDWARTALAAKEARVQELQDRLAEAEEALRFARAKRAVEEAGL